MLPKQMWGIRMVVALVVGLVAFSDVAYAE
jgi:hypothetical protein